MSNTMKDDITYMRRLAEQGRSAPILGGVFLAAAGVVFGIACIVQWAMVMRGVESVASIVELWGGAMLLFALVWVLFFLQMRSKGAAAIGITNRAFHAAWLGSGIGITVTSIGVAVAASVAQSPVVMVSYPPMVFGFYGTAWLVSGVLAQRRWMYGAALASYVFAVVLGVLVTQATMLLAMGVALFVTLTIPGILLMREKAL